MHPVQLIFTKLKWKKNIIMPYYHHHRTYWLTVKFILVFPDVHWIIFICISFHDYGLGFKQIRQVGQPTACKNFTQRSLNVVPWKGETSCVIHVWCDTGVVISIHIIMRRRKVFLFSPKRWRSEYYRETTILFLTNWSATSGDLWLIKCSDE